MDINNLTDILRVISLVQLNPNSPEVIKQYVSVIGRLKFFFLFETNLKLKRFTAQSAKFITLSKVGKGKIVCLKGDVFENVIILLSGALLLYDEAATVRYLRSRFKLDETDELERKIIQNPTKQLLPGQTFGITQLYNMTSNKSTFSIVAQENTLILNLSFNAINQMILKEYQFIVFKEELEYFKFFFSGVNLIEIVPLMPLVREGQLPHGQFLFRQNETCNAVYFIIDGECQISSNNAKNTLDPICICTQNEILGECGLEVTKHLYSAQNMRNQDMKYYIIEINVSLKLFKFVIQELQRLKMFLPNVHQVLKSKHQSRQSLIQRQALNRQSKPSPVSIDSDLRTEQTKKQVLRFLHIKSDRTFFEEVDHSPPTQHLRTDPNQTRFGEFNFISLNSEKSANYAKKILAIRQGRSNLSLNSPPRTTTTEGPPILVNKLWAKYRRRQQSMHNKTEDSEPYLNDQLYTQFRVKRVRKRRI